MTDETPVTTHVRQCVKMLNEWQQNNPPGEQQAVDRSQAFEAVFELMDLPWDEGTEEDLDFREGYETCLLDIVNAIADEWGVTLPELKVKR
jgi:hypothetical protein